MVTLEIVQRGLDVVARLLVRTDDVDLMADRMHRLLEDEDLVFFAELADQHQNFLARHGCSLLLIEGREPTIAGRAVNGGAGKENRVLV